MESLLSQKTLHLGLERRVRHFFTVVPDRINKELLTGWEDQAQCIEELAGERRVVPVQRNLLSALWWFPRGDGDELDSTALIETLL